MRILEVLIQRRFKREEDKTIQRAMMGLSVRPAAQRHLSQLAKVCGEVLDYGRLCCTERVFAKGLP